MVDSAEPAGMNITEEERDGTVTKLRRSCTATTRRSACSAPSGRQRKFLAMLSTTDDCA